MTTRFDIPNEPPEEHISRLLHLAAEAYDEQNPILAIEAVDVAREAITRIIKTQQEAKAKILAQLKNDTDEINTRIYT